MILVTCHLKSTKTSRRNSLGFERCWLHCLQHWNLERSRRPLEQAETVKHKAITEQEKASVAHAWPRAKSQKRRAQAFSHVCRFGMIRGSFNLNYRENSNCQNHSSLSNRPPRRRPSINTWARTTKSKPRWVTSKICPRASSAWTWKATISPLSTSSSREKKKLWPSSKI